MCDDHAFTRTNLAIYTLRTERYTYYSYTYSVAILAILNNDHGERKDRPV